MVSIKVFLIVALVAYAFARGTPRVIYNGDSRIDFYQANSGLQNLGASGVLIVASPTGWTQNNDGSYTLTDSRIAQDAWGLCPEEPFSQQLIAGGSSYCSGFLLSTNPPWIGTAGHCSTSAIIGAAVVFDYNQIDANTTKTEYPANDYYTVSSIVAAGANLDTGNDWGVLQLDRPVVGRTPYTSINENPTVGEALTLIGHPIGLPKKYDPQGVVTTTPGNGVITGFVDSYGGNSGSPVFDENGKLVGILVSGAQDFVQVPDENNCDISNNCPGGPTCTSSGETITSICQLGSDSRVSSLGLCGNGNVNGSTTATPSVAASSKASASATPAPTSTPTAAPNAPKGSKALVTNAYLDCNGNCTDFTPLEEEIAAYLGINATEVEIVPISRDRNSAYVQLTICANSTVLVTFSNAILSGDLDIGITQNADIVIRDAQYQKSCPIVLYEDVGASAASSLQLSLCFIAVILAILVAF